MIITTSLPEQDVIIKTIMTIMIIVTLMTIMTIMTVMTVMMVMIVMMEAAHLEGKVDDGDSHKAAGGRDLGQESVH